ncbi:MAG: hypothetical protein ACK559_22685, partial [bacterium]
TVLHDASERTLGELAEFRYSILSQFQQGKRVAVVQSGITVQFCLVDVALHFEFSSGRVDHLGK